MSISLISLEKMTKFWIDFLKRAKAKFFQEMCIPYYERILKLSMILSSNFFF